jgi:hypothetical protein
MAMIVANFSGGQAEELRRAMGFKRSEERMPIIESKLRLGMTQNAMRAEKVGAKSQSADSMGDHRLITGLRPPKHWCSAGSYDEARIPIFNALA